MDYITCYKKWDTPARIVEDKKGNTCVAYQEAFSGDDSFSMYIVGKYGNRFGKIGNTYSCMLDGGKLMLDAIYIDKAQRGIKLGDALYDFTELTTSNSRECNSVIGTFCPYDMQGVESANERDAILHKRARGLYKKKGFEIITIKDYLSDKSKYPHASESDFFDRAAGLDEDTLIIYKPMTKKTLEEYGLHLTKEGILVPKKLMHKYSSVLTM